MVLDKFLKDYLAIIETFIGVWQTSELPGTAVEVDKAGPKDRQETHFGLSRVNCGDVQIN